MGMRGLATCLFDGQGVTQDLAQGAVWFQKAADLGDAPSMAALGAVLMKGNARAGVAKDAVRGLALAREAVEQGYGAALYHNAT
jgi:TPR repeat protein